MKRVYSTSVWLWLALVCACKTKSTPAPVMPDEPAKRAAVSFVHCVEAGSSRCIKGDVGLGGWDAFSLLGWLTGGSPLTILQAFPRELERHTDAKKVQAKLVATVGRYQMVIRGAECEPVSSQLIMPLLDTVGKAAQERLTKLGLWQDAMAEVIEGLHREARENLENGHIIRMRCRSDPYQLYIATTQIDERQAVVGLTTVLPKFLGGEAPDRAVIRGRLESRVLGLANVPAPIPDNYVHSWVPTPVEEF